MTMKEFMASNDSDGFVKEKIAAMQFHVELCLINMKEGAFFEYREHLKTVQQNYYAVYGYLCASHAYGCITSENLESLVSEAIELSKIKLG